MIENNRPTAAEMRVMRGDAERVRQQREEREQTTVVDLPVREQITAVAS